LIYFQDCNDYHNYMTICKKIFQIIWKCMLFLLCRTISFSWAHDLLLFLFLFLFEETSFLESVFCESRWVRKILIISNFYKKYISWLELKTYYAGLKLFATLSWDTSTWSIICKKNSQGVEFYLLFITAPT
jgi:hypothetical protein